ncbi:hypothetical protein P7C70_g918, partial [Phenoliferia sp. Uapishka_3]
MALTWHKPNVKLLSRTFKKNLRLRLIVRSFTTTVVSRRETMLEALDAQMESPEGRERQLKESYRSKYNHGDDDVWAVGGPEPGNTVDEGDLKEAECVSGFTSRYWKDGDGQTELLALISELKNLSRLALADCSLGVRHIEAMVKAAGWYDQLLGVLGRVTTLVTSDVAYLPKLLNLMPVLNTLELIGSDYTAEGTQPTPFPPLPALQHLRIDSSPLARVCQDENIFDPWMDPSEIFAMLLMPRPPLFIQQRRITDEGTIRRILQTASTSLLTLEFGSRSGTLVGRGTRSSYRMKTLSTIRAPQLQHLSVLDSMDRSDGKVEPLFKAFSIFIASCESLKTVWIANRGVLTASLGTMPSTVRAVDWVAQAGEDSWKTRIASRSDASSELVLIPLGAEYSCYQ